MMLNKEYYKILENTLKDDNDADKKNSLNSMKEEILYEFATLVTDDKKEELGKELHFSKRFQKLLENYVSEDISYEIGTIVGIFITTEFISHKLALRNEAEIKMSAVFEKEINQKILLYLYDHPGSQHKVIAEAVGIKSNYLSQQMRELEDAGGVVRYGVDRRSFYELTLDGQAFIKNKKIDRDSHLYTHNLIEMIGLQDKWMSIAQPKVSMVMERAAYMQKNKSLNKREEKELVTTK